MEVNRSPFGPLQQSESSIPSQASTQTSDSVDLDDSQIFQTQLNLQSFVHTPDAPMHPNVARFLGPDSVEDVFGAGPRYLSSVDSPDLGSTTVNPPGTFNSLDQYVSTLDLQEGKLPPFGISEGADGASSLDWDATASHPFIPLSPYLMQVPPPNGDPLVPPELFTFFAGEYNVADQNFKLRDIYL